MWQQLTWKLIILHTNVFRVIYTTWFSNLFTVFLSFQVLVSLVKILISRHVFWNLMTLICPLTNGGRIIWWRLFWETMPFSDKSTGKDVRIKVIMLDKSDIYIYIYITTSCIANIYLQIFLFASAVSVSQHKLW